MIAKIEKHFYFHAKLIWIFSSMMSEFPMLYIILLFEFVHYIWVFCLRYMDYVFGNETEARIFARVQGWEVNYLIS